LPRNVFFSFDYDDIMGANVVRFSNVVQPDNRNLPFRDRSMYEEAKKTPNAIRQAIDSSLEGTTVTIVLVGLSTWRSDWVRYEIAKSLERGNGIFVVDIDGVGPDPKPSRGPSPLANMKAAPWRNGEGFDIWEWNGQDRYVEFGMLPRVKNTGGARYPAQFVTGEPYHLQTKFNFRVHWTGCRANFSDWIAAAAQQVGFEQTA
jgi:hypothetical protein